MALGCATSEDVVATPPAAAPILGCAGLEDDWVISYGETYADTVERLMQWRLSTAEGDAVEPPVDSDEFDGEADAYPLPYAYETPEAGACETTADIQIALAANSNFTLLGVDETVIGYNHAHGNVTNLAVFLTLNQVVTAQNISWTRLIFLTAEAARSAVIFSHYQCLIEQPGAGAPPASANDLFFFMAQNFQNALEANSLSIDDGVPLSTEQYFYAFPRMAPAAQYDNLRTWCEWFIESCDDVDASVDSDCKAELG